MFVEEFQGRQPWRHLGYGRKEYDRKDAILKPDMSMSLDVVTALL
jgi:hypothetical protein